MGNIIIGVGNAGTNCIKMAADTLSLSDVEMYAIDSVASQIDINNITKIKYFPIQADEKSGSGRSRERGSEMFKFHESNGLFNDLYEECKKAKEPILVITSAAGGTGSGASVPLCSSLISMGIQVIPLIICPNQNDPDAFHLNTNDLFIELGEVGVKTYATFENRRGDADYEPVNREVVTMIEIIFGKKYDKTDKDSIDDSDLDVVLQTPGRFIATAATGASAGILQREITRKVFSGFQQVWDNNEAKDCTILTAYSLKSLFADTEFKQVFSEINKKLSTMHQYDEYRNIVNDSNDGVSEATIIIAGLPRPAAKDVYNEYQDVSGISAGITRSKRPGFMGMKKASVAEKKDEKGGTEKYFVWGSHQKK